MVNTNGMRFPMTALKAIEVEGKDVLPGQVFDAFRRTTYQDLQKDGSALAGNQQGQPGVPKYVAPAAKPARSRKVAAAGQGEASSGAPKEEKK